jgi:hypothetical protein
MEQLRCIVSYGRHFDQLMCVRSVVMLSPMPICKTFNDIPLTPLQVPIHQLMILTLTYFVGRKCVDICSIQIRSQRVASVLMSLLYFVPASFALPNTSSMAASAKAIKHWTLRPSAMPFSYCTRFSRSALMIFRPQATIFSSSSSHCCICVLFFNQAKYALLSNTAW